MASQNLDFYQNLRNQIREWLKTDEGKSNKWSEYLLLAPDILHLICKLSVDKRVSVKDRAKLAALIAYFIAPIDLIPEAIVGPVGYLDDIALSAYVLNGIINNTDAEVVRKHWAGDGDILEIIQEILKVADEMIGAGLWKRLKAFV